MTTESETSPADEVEAIKAAAAALTAKVKGTLERAQSAQRGLLGLIADCAAAMTTAAADIEAGRAELAAENLRRSVEALGHIVSPTGVIAH